MSIKISVTFAYCFTLILKTMTDNKTTQKKYNLSVIMKRAWKIYRENNGKLSWSECLKQSWSIAKNGITTKDFDKVYKKYYNQVYYHVNGKLSNNPIVAEEITNDVFMKAYEHIDNYDVHMGKINTWLITIAGRKVIDYWRSKAKRNYDNTALIDGYVDESGNETYQVGADIMDGQNSMESRELGVIISKAFDCLNERDKNLCELYFLHEHSYEEISEIMDIPLGTVKGTLNRCRGKLQSKLQRVY